LPYSQLREMRSFFISRGIDIFPSEHKHRAAAGELATEYETGFVALPGGKRAHFIRVADVWGTIRRLAIARHEAGELSFWPTQPRDRLKLHVSMDKGGKYTKLMLTWLNHRSPQSARASTVLALFQYKEQYSVVLKVFGPLLTALASPPADFPFDSETERPFGTVPSNPHAPFISGHCARCRRFSATPSQPWCPRRVGILGCYFTYGGDLPAEHCLLGTAGTSGTYFCTCCMCTREALANAVGRVHALKVMRRWRDAASHQTPQH
jgi:hypothetical protein